MEKYYNEMRQVVLLHSNAYGSGWSSLEANHGDMMNAYFLMFNQNLITMYFNKSSAAEVKKYLNESGILYPKDIETTWTDELTHTLAIPYELIFVHNYDGLETIKKSSDIHFFRA